jgi:hypothetical protein
MDYGQDYGDGSALASAVVNVVQITSSPWTNTRLRTADTPGSNKKVLEDKKKRK